MSKRSGEIGNRVIEAVMVVEPDVLVRMTVADYLRECGYRVVEVAIDYNERVGASKLRKLAGTVWTMIRLARALPVGARGGSRFEVR